MALTLQLVPLPLRMDDRGGLRVGDSRVSLDVVIEEFENGATPESIVHAYDTLQLADVYAVIAYYLHNREEVNQYLQDREAAVEKLRQEIEAKQGGQDGLREKLLARKAQMEQEKALREQEHASPGK